MPDVETMPVSITSLEGRRNFGRVRYTIQIACYESGLFPDISIATL